MFKVCLLFFFFLPQDGDTPLLKATRNRNAEIVQMLVDKKCRVSAADKVIIYLIYMLLFFNIIMQWELTILQEGKRINK